MKEIKQLATKSDCYKAGKELTTKRGVLIHSTATPGADAEAFAKVWNKSGVNACTHAVCDDSNVIQLLPYDMKCWGCGGGGNNHYIQIEMCEPSYVYYVNGWDYRTKDEVKTREYIEKCVSNAIEWTVARLLEMGIKEVNATTVTSHYEAYKLGIASNHGDPKQYLNLIGLNMDKFRERCRKLMNEKLGTNKNVTGLKDGDVITLKSGAVYSDNKEIPDWVFKKTLYYRGENDKGVIFSTLKSGAITGVVDSKYINELSVTSLPYKVKVTADALNYRQGPGTSYKILGTIRDKGVYTIIEESNGWGKLKSGAGWICLEYTSKV